MGVVGPLRERAPFSRQHQSRRRLRPLGLRRHWLRVSLRPGLRTGRGRRRLRGGPCTRGRRCGRTGSSRTRGPSRAGTRSLAGIADLEVRVHSFSPRASRKGGRGLTRGESVEQLCQDWTGQALGVSGAEIIGVQQLEWQAHERGTDWRNAAAASKVGGSVMLTGSSARASTRPAGAMTGLVPSSSHIARPPEGGTRR